MTMRGKLMLGFLAFLILGLAPLAGAQTTTPDLTGTYIGSMNAVAQSGYFTNVAIKMVVTDQQDANGIIYFRGNFSAAKPFSVGVAVPITGTIEGGTNAHITADTHFS